jgi:uncharacterized protein (TIGR03083 family)
VTLPPLLTAHLFPALHAKLIELLRSLDDDEWELQTVAPAWRVRDVAAHLLDTQQRLLSRLRGQPQPPPPAIPSPADLVALINRLNDEGIRRYRRLDPADLIDLIQGGADEFARHHQSVDPFAAAPFGVSWAGEQTSANWFHTAREFTERWHHQQQIRLAAGRAGIMTPELYHPVLECFMRALPFAYRDQTRPAGSLARVNVSGDCGGSWYLHRDPDRWRLIASPSGRQLSETTIPQEIAWLIFTKGIRRAEAEPQVRVTGDADLGRRVLEMITVVG